MKYLRKSILYLILSCIISLCFIGCSNKKKAGDQADSKDTAVSSVLKAPTDFTFDTKTGAYSFTANDSNAGYYYIRAFSVSNGKENIEYSASSARIDGGTTGKMTGNVDISTMGWGNYDIKLVTFSASGTKYKSPDATIIKVEYGIGGTLEKPEMLVMADGNQAEFVIDWYTLSDYLAYQIMPKMTFNIYSDKKCTKVVKTDTVDLTKLLPTKDIHPAMGAPIWGYQDSGAFHMYSYTKMGHAFPGGPLVKIHSSLGFLHDLYTYKLDPGTYYVTCQASTDITAIKQSKASDVVEFTLTKDNPTGKFKAANTKLWEGPTVMGKPYAKAGECQNRVDMAKTQKTNSKSIE